MSNLSQSGLRLRELGPQLIKLRVQVLQEAGSVELLGHLSVLVGKLLIQLDQSLTLRSQLLGLLLFLMRQFLF